MLAHAYNIMIDNGVIALVHGRDAVGGLNTTNFLSMLIQKVKLTGSRGYVDHVEIHTSTHK